MRAVCLAFIMAMLLVSCSEEPSGDFEECQEGKITLELNIVEDVPSAYKDRFGTNDGSPLRGFTVLNDGPPQMYVSLPSSREDYSGTYIIGHEFLHAACGMWHGDSEHY